MLTQMLGDKGKRMTRAQLIDALRLYGDIASAGDKMHWGLVMREAAAMLSYEGSGALVQAQRTGLLLSELRVCQICDGTGYVA